MTVHSSIGDWISASYEREVPFLQQIPRESADFFLLNSEIREYEAGDVIITGDREGESFCVLQCGRAQICGKTLADGRCNSLGWLDAGACFGEMSILCNEKTSNTVIAVNGIIAEILIYSALFADNLAKFISFFSEAVITVKFA